MVLTKKNPEQIIKEFKKAHKSKTPVSRDTLIHAYGTAVIVSYLHQYICKTFVSDNDYYSRKTKYYIDGLIRENSSLFDNAEALRKLHHPELKNIEKEEDIDTELLTDEIQTQIDAISNFIRIYLFSNLEKFCNFALILENIRKNKKVYTEEEVRLIAGDAVRKAVLDLTKIEPTNLLIEKYV